MQKSLLKQLCGKIQSDYDDVKFNIRFDNINPKKDKITHTDVKRCMIAKQKFLEKVQQMGRSMPPNTLDKLISELGGTEQVAEMTNRRGRVVKSPNECYKYELRANSTGSLDEVNIAEKHNFMADRKHVAIISEAASTGYSLQSDRDVANQRQRLHICMEMPCSVDRILQQLGRTKRTNQVNEPEFVIVINNLASEYHLASMLSQRLTSLGAVRLDHDKAKLKPQPLFKINNKLGSSALDTIMQQLTRRIPLETIHVPESYEGEFIADCCESLAAVGILKLDLGNVDGKSYVMEKDRIDILTFFERLLGCHIKVQNALFNFFLGKMYALMQNLKRTGGLDLGIIDLDVHNANISINKVVHFKKRNFPAAAATDLYTIEMKCGISFLMAVSKLKSKQRDAHEGFYILQQARNDKNCAILCLNDASESNFPETILKNKIKLKIYRPNTGAQVKTEVLSSICNRYVKVSPKLAQQYWDMQYTRNFHVCSHIYWTCRCPYGRKCELGMRKRIYHVLSGQMVSIWPRVALILEENGCQMRMVRYKANDNRKIVGIVIPDIAYRRLITDLSSYLIVQSK